MYTATEAPTIELSPSAHLFDEFAETSAHEYARHMEETTAGIQDGLVSGPFI